MASKFKTALESFYKQKKAKKQLNSWTDSVLLRIRDKLRRFARKNRGEWTLEFYEVLQEINKEAAKRKLPQETK